MNFNEFFLPKELQSRLDMLPVWHKVSDCKPPEDTRVLVFICSITRPYIKYIQIDTYTREDDFGLTRVPCFRTYGNCVTHWMPLPKEP